MRARTRSKAPGNMVRTEQSCDPRVHDMAIRLARACRNVIQAVLREEEWGDADREFTQIIRQGIEDLLRREQQ
jgi:hypothetical protein